MSKFTQYTPTSGAGSGDVTGPGSSTTGDLAEFADASGKLLADSGIASTDVVQADAALTDFAVVCGDTASKNVQSIAGLGTSGQILTSNGAGALPTFQDASGGVSGPVSSTDNALSRWDGTSGDTLQDSTVIVSDNGEMTNASQPAFLAYNSADDTNQTGNGAPVTVDFDTEVYDRGGNFSADTFTAPVTGLYHFDVCVRFENLTAAMTNMDLQLVTTNRTYQFNGNPGASKTSFDIYSASFSVLADMTATDTASVSVAISGGAGDTAGISGASTLITYFSGHLVA